MTQSAKSVVLVLFTALIIAVIGFATIRSYGVLDEKIDVRIDSTPSGALVMLDDKLIGRTPVALPDFKIGAHDLLLKLEGYKERHELIRVTKSDIFKFDLQKMLTCTLSVDSEPASARVYINGIERGTTPLTLDMESGKHTLTLIKANYDEHIETLVIADEPQVSIKRNLVPAFEAYYKAAIAAEPENLYFYSDLIRYYFVKGRADDLAELVQAGLDQFAKGIANNDENFRFFQEITKISTDDKELYQDKLLPAICDWIVTKTPDGKDRTELFTKMQKEKRTGALAADIAMKMIVMHPNEMSFLKYLLENTTLFYRAIRIMKPEELEQFLSKVETAGDNEPINSEWFKIYRQLGDYFSTKRQNDRAEAAYKRAVTHYTDKIKLDDLSDLYYRLILCLSRQNKYDAIVSLATKVLDGGYIVERHKKLIEAELEKARKRVAPAKK